MRTYTVRVEGSDGTTINISLRSRFGDGAHALGDLMTRLGYSTGHYDGLSTITLS